jgi:NAD(P)H dehydrogenase (quinone)
VILVTGAGGKTGRALLHELSRLERPCRALVHRVEQTPETLQAGATEAIVGDLLETDSLEAAFEGVSSVYHIPPNIHPQEIEIGERMLELAVRHGIGHFVYHSVLHPYVKAMPHHLKKAEVEDRIYASGLPFTILQPEAYMQNFLPGFETARNEGTFPVPYPANSKLGMVDLRDVSSAAALVLGNPEHFWATYELSAGETWTPASVAEAIATELNKAVSVVEIDRMTWEQGAQRSGLSRYRVETLLKMFDYYAQHGFWGNSRVLRGLLGQPPRTFLNFVHEQLNLRNGG